MGDDFFKDRVGLSCVGEEGEAEQKTHEMTYGMSLGEGKCGSGQRAGGASLP